MMVPKRYLFSEIRLMPYQNELALHFASLHVKGAPLIMFNAWDAGSARAVASAGARAIGTSSMALAAAQGYDDGERIPFSTVELLVERIASAVGIAVSVDAEGAYSTDCESCARNVMRLVELGVVGINFEDGIVGGSGLHAIDAQCERIAAIRGLADARGAALFINARTDVFLSGGLNPDETLAQCVARAAAYAAAGANGFFVPGLVSLAQIGELAAAIALPLNVMMMPGLPPHAALADAGVARISYGPGPYLQAMAATGAAARLAFT